MTLFADVDLSSLPKPDVIETIDYEAILTELVADFLARYPEYSAETLESDPIMKALEAAAYREVNLRQRANDAARARMLPYAEDADLEVLAADAGVYRLQLTAADPDAVPPVEGTYETNASLRRRTQLAPESLTTAGSEGSYVYNALSATETPVGITVSSPESGTVVLTYTFDPAGSASKIKDATAIRPQRGDVLVTVLGWNGDGTVDAGTLAQVEAALSAKTVRPLCCDVTVQSAEVLTYVPRATLTVYEGLDADAIKAAALTAMQTVAEKRHRLGEKVTGSVVDAALHVSGVQKVTLNGWADVVCTTAQAPYMTACTLDTEVAE